MAQESRTQGMSNDWFGFAAPTVIVMAVSVLAVAIPLEPKMIYVDAGAPPDGAGTIAGPFRTISSGVLMANEGDTVLVRKGVYTEAIVLERDGIILAAWGPEAPELHRSNAPSLTIRADDCTVQGLRFTGAKGIKIDAAFTTIHNCTFDNCAQPVRAWGRAHTVMLCQVRNCRSTEGRSLFEIVGPGSYIGGNRFLHNTSPNGAAISCRGRGTAVRNNIVFGAGQHTLRYAIDSTSGPEDSLFDSCTDQQIAYNRLYGGAQTAFIHIGGERHAGTRVVHNTIVDTKGGVEGIQVSSTADEVTVESNLVGGDIEFASTDPTNRGFLWPKAAYRVDTAEIPKKYVGARPAWPSPDLRNLAFGKTYLFQAVPTHGNREVWSTCLTDGYAPGKMWGKDTDGTDFTGWHISGRENRLFIRLDLGQLSDVEAVRVQVAHNHVWRAGMPLRIDVSVSDGDWYYRHAGTILSDLPRPPGDYFVGVDGLRARGRYVLLTLHTDRSYTALDEVEVLGREAAAGEQRMSLVGTNAKLLHEILRAGDRPARLSSSPAAGRYTAPYRRNKAELKAVKSRAEELGVQDHVSSLIRQAAEIIRTKSSPDSRPNLEVAEALRRVSTTVLRAVYGDKDLLVSASTPYARFSGSHIPGSHEVGIEEVSISACQDEREPSAFFLTNSTASDMAIQIDLSECSSAAGVVFPSNQIVLRSPVDFTIGDPDRKFKGDYFRDQNNALVLLDHGAGHQLTVKSLDTRQVWITADTTDVAPGTYHGSITLVAEGMKPISLNLVIVVHPIKIPEQLELYAYMWSYWRSSRVVNYRQEAFRDAILHKANSILDHSIPHPANVAGSVDEDGHLVKPMNYELLDWQIDQWNRNFKEEGNKVKFYIFWLAFSNAGYDELQMGIPVGTPKWNTLIVEWFSDIAAHLEKKHGMTTDDFAFYIYDELEARQVVNYIEPMADALRAADPKRYPYARKIKFFVNPMSGTVLSTSWKYFEERYSKLGVLAPLAGDYPAPVLESLHGSGNRVWSHSTAGKGAGYDAKLTGWRSMQQGFGGQGFFIYIYSRYPNGYDRVYTRMDKVPGAGDETIVPSRTWEAWRDGQEDWHLLLVLKRLAHKARKSDGHAGDFVRAMKVFHGAIDAVFASSDDPRVAVAHREKIIAEILRLRALMKAD